MTLPVLGDWIIFSDTQLHHTWPLQWIILTIQMMNFFKLVYGGLFQTPNDNQCSSFRHVPLKIIVINTPVSYTMIISKLSIHSDYHCDWNQCSLQWFFGDQRNLHWFEVWILPTVSHRQPLSLLLFPSIHSLVCDNQTGSGTTSSVAGRYPRSGSPGYRRTILPNQCTIELCHRRQ